MWILRGTRRILLEVLGANGGTSQIALQQTVPAPPSELKRDELVLMWELEQGPKLDLPSLAVIPNGELNDFLAWTSTFAPGFLPFTAFVRVLEARATKTFWKYTEPALGEGANYCAGLILGEVISQASQKIDPASLSPLGCASTLSYCMARALGLGLLDECADRIVEKWAQARHLLGQPDRKLRVEAIRDVWLILADVLNGDRFTLRNRLGSAASGAIVHGCLELKTASQIALHTWRDLVGNSKELLVARERMQGPREERVTRFEDAVANLAHTPTVNPEVASFLCGYLASLIDPGSLTHARLLSPLLDRFPTALLWYGLCAGFHQKNELLSQFNALGRRVLRDVVNPESLLSRPQSDIAIEELEVFLRGDKPLREFHRGSPKHISIEIAPRIRTTLNWPDHSAREQEDLTGSRGYADNEYVGKQLGQVIQSLNQIRDRLVGPKRFQPESIPRDKVLPSAGFIKDRGKRRR